MALVRPWIREPINGFSHLLGALLATAGLVLLIVAASHRGALHITAVSIFGASMIGLYAASAAYHLAVLSPKGTALLRRIDHVMVFVLIAGTYTPICLLVLRGGWGWSIFGVVWGLALAGVPLKVFWLGAPRWLTTLLYLGMGWLVVVAVVPLVRSLSPAGLAWLLGGGLAYSAGAAIYGLRRPRLWPGAFGFHELFHLLCLVGTWCHFWLIYRHVLPGG